MFRLLFGVFCLCYTQIGFSLIVPTSSGSITLPVTLTSSSGQSSNRQLSWQLAGGTGTFTIAGKSYECLAYEYQNWADYNLVLIDLIGLASDNSGIGVVYLYLNSSNVIYDCYYESFTTAITSNGASGPIQYTEKSESVKYSLPGIANLPSIKSNSIKISGSTIVYSSGTGWALNQAKTNFTITTFVTVDCTDCGSGGWYELHSFFYDGKSVGCFGIIYLEFPNHNVVTMVYGMCFGGTASYWSESWAATWSGNLSINNTNAADLIATWRPRKQRQFV